MNRQHYFYLIPIILQKIGCCIFFVLFKIFAQLEIVGREKLKGLTGPVILSSNHTSELDATALPLVLPFFSSLRPVYFIMKPAHKFNNFGWRSYLYGSGFLTLMGGYSIRSGYKNYAISLNSHIRLLKQGRTVCIFPEGKRTQDGFYGPAHGGLGYLIYSTRATVVPIAIDTFFGINWKEFFLRRRKVTIKIGNPIKAGDIISALPQNPSPEDFRRVAQFALDKSKEMMRTSEISNLTKSDPVIS